MIRKVCFLSLLLITTSFAVNNSENNEENIESEVAEEKEEQGSGKDNIASKEENAAARATPLDLQKRYWPICEQLEQFVPQLCFVPGVAKKCENVCNNREPVLDCGIRMPPDPTKKKDKKKKQLKKMKELNLKKQLKKKVGNKITNKGSKRIVGGKESQLAEWNWQVFLEGKYNSTSFFKCGAAILSKNFILTAGHCLEPTNPLLNVNRWWVSIGDHDMTRGDEGNQKDHEVKKIMRHKGYQNLPRGSRNDIAIFQLKDEIKVEEEDKGRICLPDDDKPIPEQGKTCYVTGWGKISENGNSSAILKHAPVLTVSRQVCNLPASYDNEIDETMFCAGHKQGKTDSCQGDSGGSLACKMGDGLNARWYSGGVVSWGEGCAQPNQYGVYANTTYFKDWIVKTILEESDAL